MSPISVHDLVYRAKLGTTFRIENRDDERDFVQFKKGPIGGWTTDLGRFGSFEVKLVEAAGPDYVIIVCEMPY